MSRLKAKLVGWDNALWPSSPKVQGRVYLSPTVEAEAVALNAQPTWRPSGDVPARLTGGTCVPYGLKEWGDLFTPRQLVALTTFSDLVGEARKHITSEALGSGMSDDGRGVSTLVATGRPHMPKPSAFIWHLP